MKTITLSRRLVAKVDDEDFLELSKYKWHARKDKKIFYAGTNGVFNGKRKTILMHRFLLNAKEGDQVDHRDRDGLNNQRINISICSASNQMINRVFHNSTGFRGVFLIKKTGRFTGAIQVNKKRIRIGCYATSGEAALAYNEKAKQLHGSYAILNEVHL